MTALIILLTALLIGAGFTLHAQHKALERGQKVINELGRRSAEAQTLADARTMQIIDLSRRLEHATKNDHRDAKGRFTSLSKSPAKR
jgi:cell division protein FtsL